MCGGELQLPSFYFSLKPTIMKVLWLSILITFMTVRISSETTLIKPSDITLEVEYVDFKIAYNRVRKEEGYYSNHPKDLGKETYAGITKKYNPTWYGWNYVDKYQLKQNQPVTGVDSLITEYYVQDFYLDIWVKEGFYLLQNQEVANYLFDTRVNLSRKQTIKLLNRTYSTPVVNTEQWVLSSMDHYNITLLKKTRTNYYLTRIKANPSQVVWKKGWLKRANK